MTRHSGADKNKRVLMLVKSGDNQRFVALPKQRVENRKAHNHVLLNWSADASPLTTAHHKARRPVNPPTFPRQSLRAPLFRNFTFVGGDNGKYLNRNASMFTAPVQDRPCAFWSLKMIAMPPVAGQGLAESGHVVDRGPRWRRGSGLALEDVHDVLIVDRMLPSSTACPSSERCGAKASHPGPDPECAQ